MVGGDNKDDKPEESGCGFTALALITSMGVAGGIGAAACRWKSTCSIF